MPATIQSHWNWGAIALASREQRLFQGYFIEDLG